MALSPLSISASLTPSSKDKDKKKDSAVVLQLTKTKMCAFFERGKCSSETCRYAHSQDELRRAPNLQKTKLCKSFLQGRCRDGENCSFAHGEGDLRVTDGIYKTQMCNFYERGYCKKGDRCNHAHGDRDLRPAASPQKTPVKERGQECSLQTPDAPTPPKLDVGDRSPEPRKGRVALAELLPTQEETSVLSRATLAFALPAPLSWTSYQMSPTPYSQEPATPLRMLDPVDMLVDSGRREMLTPMSWSVSPQVPQLPWSPCGPPPGLTQADVCGDGEALGHSQEKDLVQSRASLDEAFQGFQSAVEEWRAQ
eukprot:CAMPEP_0181438132 /NCGR_PEP_ID=MMETSP1110-20121109/21747_1 /TAXON_ID=174948 /ORGANISM="Symbiodinium sp., Strain CCMP421" /LENGTH=309 /DNA_ID=CAMNT_0023561801 /DNA_START=81 /DNA_END=1010 /DNA_ORIENTATION=-